MCKLQIIKITRVTAFRHRNYVVNARTKRVRLAHGFIYRLATDSAHSLGGHNFLLVPLECKAMGAVLIRAITLCLCHGLTFHLF